MNSSNFHLSYILVSRQISSKNVHKDPLSLSPIEFAVWSQARYLRERHKPQNSILLFEVGLELITEVVIFKDEHSQKGTKFELRIGDLFFELFG